MPPAGLVLHNCHPSSFNVLQKGKGIKENLVFRNILHASGEKKNECMILFGKPDGKRSFGRPRCRWDENA